MNVKLYSIPGSHPAAAARAMLEHKGIEYWRVDLPPVVSRRDDARCRLSRATACRR